MPRSAARATNVRVLALEQGDHGPGPVLDDLLDQVERVIVVVVEDDHGDVGLVGGDLLGRLPDADGVGEHLMAEALHDAREVLQRGGVLVRGEHAQAVAEVLVHGASGTGEKGRC